MLCKRPTKKIEDSIREMGNAEFIIEEKLDGERMQLHKRGNEYFYCSRYDLFRWQVQAVEPPFTGKGKIILTCMVNTSGREV
jgi:hypothetical protein